MFRVQEFRINFKQSNIYYHLISILLGIQYLNLVVSIIHTLDRDKSWCKGHNLDLTNTFKYRRLILLEGLVSGLVADVSESKRY